MCNGTACKQRVEAGETTMAENVGVCRRLITTEVQAHPQVSTSTSAPVGAPRAAGDLHVDTAAQRLWVASTASAWTVANASAFCHREVTGDATVVASDGTIGVHSTSPVVITLPPVATFPASRTRITITDEGGNAGSGGQVDIVASNAETISGNGFYSLSADFASVSLYCTSRGWFVGAAS